MIGALSFIYLLHELSIFFRAAEDLLSQIQKNYQKPQEELKKMKEAAGNGRESYISQRRDLHFKGRSHMHDW